MTRFMIGPIANCRLQLSAQLKTRLSYAMVKVQNGWEKRSIEELEEVQSQRPSPTASSGTTDAYKGPFESPRAFERRRRSGVSDHSDQYMASPGQDSPLDLARSLNSTPACMYYSFDPCSLSSPASNSMCHDSTPTTRFKLPIGNTHESLAYSSRRRI